MPDARTIIADIRGMNLDQVTTEMCVLIAAAACLFILYRSKAQRSANLPPGPPGDPILGHLRYMPFEYTWVTFAKWAKKYGDVIHIHVFGKPTIVLSTFAAARELMEKRGRNYSDRPRQVYISEIAGWRYTMPFLQYSDEHRRQRSMVHAIFTPQGIVNYRPVMEARAEELVKSIKRAPDAFRGHIHHYIASNVLRITYGYEFESPNDPKKILADKLNAVSAQSGTVGGPLCEFMPILAYVPKWLPGFGFLRHAKKISDLREAMKNDLYDYSWKSRQEGSELPSMMASLFDKYGDEIETDPGLQSSIRELGGIMYAAGVDTSEITITTSVLMMTRYPRFTKAAQKEIDEVTGGERLPTFEDRKLLPSVECILKEVWRWNPPLPLGLAHQSRDEDTYNGMTIPAKSSIMPNIWQMLRDEDIYHDPFTFNPERFLPLVTSGSELPNAGDPKSIVFGFGRRSCPGIHLADAAVWLSLACILAAFDILPPINPETGKEEVPEERFSPAIISIPCAFGCRLVPRVGIQVHSNG